MSYRVTAPLVLARDKEGKVHERYQDAVIDWLDDDQKRHFLEAKLVERIGASAPVEETDDEPITDGEKPAEDATKPVLVKWLAENVAKEDGSDYTKTELNKMSPEDLRAIVDSVE